MEIDFRNFVQPDGPTPEEEYRTVASSEVAFEAAFGRMMLELVETLRHDVVGPRLVAWKDMLGPGLLFHYSDGSGRHVTVSATVDYMDRSPLLDGLPQLHYRLGREPAQPGQSVESRHELRTPEVRAACQFIVEAIGDCRGTD